MFCLHLESGPSPLEILKTLPWVWQVAAKPITTQRCVLNQRGRGRGLWGGVLREWRQSCASHSLQFSATFPKPTKLELNFGKVSYSVVVHRQLACLFGTSDNKSPTPSQNAKVIHCPAHISWKAGWSRAEAASLVYSGLQSPPPQLSVALTTSQSVALIGQSVGL